MIAPEFSRRVRLNALGPKPTAHSFDASEAECAAVARRLGVEGVSDLRVEATLRLRSEGGVVTRGRVEANVIRRSVVTLEPFEGLVAEEFDTMFLPEVAAEALIEFDPLGDDIEPLQGDMVDVGELAVQYLALGLDPHPRGPADPPEAVDEP